MHEEVLAEVSWPIVYISQAHGFLQVFGLAVALQESVGATGNSKKGTLTFEGQQISLRR